VLEKLMFAPAGVPPAFVVSKEVAVVVTGPVMLIAPPLVVTFAFRLMAAAVAERPVRGVPGRPPMAPLKVVVPVPPAMVSARAPLMVLLKVTLALLEVMVLVPVKSTGLGKVRGLAPEIVMLFPIWIWPALVKIRFVGGAVPPTTPPKETTPPVPARRVRGTAPFNVLEKLMFAPAGVPPPLVLSIVMGVLVIETGPVMVMTPLVVTFPPTLITVDPV
jgi:hypothetical protein